MGSALSSGSSGANKKGLLTHKTSLHKLKISDVTSTRQGETLKPIDTTRYYDYRDKQLSMKSIVEHNMPPDFPIVDYLTSEDISICRQSWDLICHGTMGTKRPQNPSGFMVDDADPVSRVGYSSQSSMMRSASADPPRAPSPVSRSHTNMTKSTILVELVDEFYLRLFQRTQKFREIFSNVRERASVLTKAMTFILSVNLLPEKERNQRYKDAADLHRALGISHWMFSKYMSTLLESIAFVLKTRGEATFTTMQSWMRLASYSLRLMLENVIVTEDIHPFEFAANFNTKSARQQHKDRKKRDKKLAEKQQFALKSRKGVAPSASGNATRSSSPSTGNLVRTPLVRGLDGQSITVAKDTLARHRRKRSRELNSAASTVQNSPQTTAENSPAFQTRAVDEITRASFQRKSADLGELREDSLNDSLRDSFARNTSLSSQHGPLRSYPINSVE